MDPRILELLDRPEFPRSRRWDADFMLGHQMGPNAVWLVEWLAGALDLRPGMRVLDLGCGRAMTSIFLAKEFGVRVWAADLWIGPDINWRSARAAGVADLVCPIRAEAHALPFAAGFFDAIVSVDAWQYFGTDVLYLGYATRFLRPGGVIGMVDPGLMREIGDTVPDHLAEPQSNGKVFWEDACWSFHTAAWWETTWRRTSTVRDVAVDTLPDGWRHWRDFERAVELSGRGVFPSDAEALDRDAGSTMGFVRAVARRTEVETENLYDPTIGVRAGVDR
jgi:SAM-dependent methyltransferase